MFIHNLFLQNSVYKFPQVFLGTRSQQSGTSWNSVKWIKRSLRQRFKADRKWRLCLLWSLDLFLFLLLNSVWESWNMNPVCCHVWWNEYKQLKGKWKILFLRTIEIVSSTTKVQNLRDRWSKWCHLCFKAVWG